MNEQEKTYEIFKKVLKRAINGKIIWMPSSTGIAFRCKIENFEIEVQKDWFGIYDHNGHLLAYLTRREVPAPGQINALYKLARSSALGVDEKLDKLRDLLSKNGE